MNPKLQIFSEFIKFSIVGVMNTLITLLIIFLLMKILKINYIISNICGYIVGLINSFIWNKFWTFKSKGDFKKEGILFLSVYIFVYFLQLGFLIFTKEIIKIPVDIAQIMGMIFYTIIGFLGNKIITFRRI